MKKTLLFALFCGFVLNNGYCFDGEHKITEEDLNESFNELIEIEKKLRYLRRDIQANAALMSEAPRFVRALDRIFDKVRYKIRDNLEKFGTEFLKTVIPSGEDKGKTVENLLGEHKLNNDHMQMICDDSVKYNVKYNVEDSVNSVTFELDGGTMGVSHRLDYYYCDVREFASLYIPLLGFLDSVELRQYEPLTSL